MNTIARISSREVLNSRADWTIETQVELSDGSIGTEAVPEGASKGAYEAAYIAPQKAAEVINSVINDALVGESPNDQKKIDDTLIAMDGTPNKTHLGGNSLLSVSLAVAKAVAVSKKLPLYRYLHEIYSGDNGGINLHKYPTPLFNIINGGKHSQNNLSFQEFMVIPSGVGSFEKALELGVKVYKQLKQDLNEAGMSTSVGDEGGFAPEGLTAVRALNFIKNSASKIGTVGGTLFFGMDAAAGSFYKDGVYRIQEESLVLSGNQLAQYYENLRKKFEIIYLEDAFFGDDHTSFREYFPKVKDKLMLVGDDLVVTNTKLLNRAIEESLINAVIVKPNQIGTLSETFDFIRLAKKSGMSVIISHRSGESAEDTFIADLAVAVGAEFIKSGAPVRGERVAKYNRLLEIFKPF